MSREIRFRGQRLDNKEWVYGGYFQHTEEDFLIHYIFTFENGAIPVDKNTISEFTGLKDKLGIDIWERDIVAGYGFNTKDNTHIPPTKGNEVVFKNGCFEWRNEVLGWDMSEGEIPAPYDTQKWALVIGNVHENPELLTK